METPTYRIVGPSGTMLADGLPISAPSIQLHEGRITEPAAPYPKDLAPGEFTTVDYPLDAERGQERPTLRCTVTRTDAPPDVALVRSTDPRSFVAARSAPPEPDLLSFNGIPIPTTRGGRRTRGGRTS